MWSLPDWYPDYTQSVMWPQSRTFSQAAIPTSNPPRTSENEICSRYSSEPGLNRLKVKLFHHQRFWNKKKEVDFYWLFQLRLFNITKKDCLCQAAVMYSVPYSTVQALETKETTTTTVIYVQHYTVIRLYFATTRFYTTIIITLQTLQYVCVCYNIYKIHELSYNRQWRVYKTDFR